MRSFNPANRQHDVADRVDALLERGYRYAFSLAHDAIEAEDLLQDACVAILASGGSWEPAYVFTTIRNRFIDRYRRNRKILFLSLDHEGEGGEGEHGDLNWDAPDVLQNGQLGRAIGSLRAEEREALFLAVVEGYTAEEIAVLTSRPRGTILSLLYRTKAKLRDLLHQQKVLP
ncbi:MAG TPA: RNA polymerase sigma factor [Thermoanaerobaculia bacterium]|nr:RNA polymerase sigma factor [Thermoanaerobaculia bacterium]